MPQLHFMSTLDYIDDMISVVGLCQKSSSKISVDDPTNGVDNLGDGLDKPPLRVDNPSG